MRLKISLLLSFIAFVIGLSTLPHYGINWDTINHLPRGHVYLRYILTGEKTVDNVTEFKEYWEKETLVKEKSTPQSPRYRLYHQKDSLFFNPDIPREKIPRISMYNGSFVDFDYFMKTDGDGHPPLSDILSTAFNVVLFEKLGLINDVDSYRVYGILLASILVGLIFWWTSSAYGRFAGLIAALSLFLYPLFLAESHFNNEKDIPEAVFWSFMLFSIWRGIVFNKWKWVLASGVFLGLALGTKFNILFSPLVVIPWLILYLLGGYFKDRKNIDLKYIFETVKRHLSLISSAILAPIIGITIFVVFWPYLWPDPIGKIGKVINFYKTIGTTSTVSPEFLGPFNSNTFAIEWILYTTPLVILILATIGVVTILTKKWSEKDKISILFLLWLIAPILRGTWPGSNLYGGVRQIMEFIPALAIIAGLGGSTLRDILTTTPIFKRKKWICSLLILGMFLPITIKLIQIHPNENVYFNPLIGGLKGAKERNFPYWGNSFGGAYRQGVNWINQNAEKGAKMSYAYELMVNIPLVWFRSDIHFVNQNRSGFLRRGEYVITLVFEGTNKRSYFDMYLDRILDPVYEVTVDDVSILKVWKNDETHVKSQWKNEEVIRDVSYEEKSNGILFDIGEIRKLSRLEIDYVEKEGCPKLTLGYIELSKDGQSWERVPGVLPDDWRVPVLGEQPNNGKFIEPFVGQEARYISFVAQPVGTCVLNVKDIKLYYFK